MMPIAQPSIQGAPVLRTVRLVLRAARMDDFPAYAAFVTSDRTRFMGGPHGAATAWAWFCNDLAQWALLGMGGLIVTRDGRPIGQVAVCRNPEFPEPELGWFLFDPADEGQGYATEAAAALRDWALGPRGLPTLVAYVDPENTPSRRLAERLGARLDPSAATPEGMATLVYRWGRA
jgi:RimJ/RimL family protein N-acetyltransferase